MEIRHLGLTRADRVFIPSPLAHQTGFLYGMWLAITLGVAQILQPVWNGPAALETLRRWRGTFTQAATPFLADLVGAVERTGQPPEALRIFVATGAAVPRALAERATRELGAVVCGAWGTTETCLGTLSAPGDEAALVWGTDGRALSGVDVRVVDGEGAVLGPGQEGNFEVTSRCLFAGYLDRPEWTAQAMTADGWYRSGDLAVRGRGAIAGRVVAPDTRPLPHRRRPGPSRRGARACACGIDVAAARPRRTAPVGWLDRGAGRMARPRTRPSGRDVGTEARRPVPARVGVARRLAPR